MRWCTRRLFKYENVIVLIRNGSDARAIQQVFVWLDLKGAPQVAFWSWQSSDDSRHIFKHEVHRDRGQPSPILLPISSPAYQTRHKQLATCIKRRSRRELLRADNNTKWIFSNREKQLSPLFECFTFPRSINWLFDHRQRCAVTDKEQVISKVAWRTERQPAVAACWRWDNGMVM